MTMDGLGGRSARHRYCKNYADGFPLTAGGSASGTAACSTSGPTAIAALTESLTRFFAVGKPALWRSSIAPRSP